MTDRKKKLLIRAAIALPVALLCFYGGNRYAQVVMSSPLPFPDNLTKSFPALLASIEQRGFFLDTALISLMSGFLMFLALWIIWARLFAFVGNSRAGEESGSAVWGSKKQGLIYRDRKNPMNNILYSENFGMTVNWKLRDFKQKDRIQYERNHNTMVIGGSGSGKTFSFVKPNLMQLYGNYFVTDPKGDVLIDMGHFFEKNDYDIKSFNTYDFDKSLHYNPLAYVKTDEDILTFVNCLIRNTTPADASSGDPFWENSERLLYIALIALLRDWFRPEDYSLSGLITLLDLAEAREDDESFQSPLDLLFKQIEDGGLWRQGSDSGAPATPFSRIVAKKAAMVWQPSSFKHTSTGVKPAEVEQKDRATGQVIKHGLTVEQDFALNNYNAFKVAAGKTLKSIIISCNVRVKPLAISKVREMLKYDEMELDKLGDPDRKIVVFAIPKDTDKTFSFLLAIMMWQTIELLCRKALLVYKKALPTHVQFIFDEFSNIGTIPEIEETIAVVRSRNIGIDIILQSMSQLEKRYDKAAGIIVDCCDTTQFLGGKSNTTNKEISEMIGQETIHQTTFNETYGQNGSSTKNMQIQGRDLIQAAEIGKMSRSDTIILIAGTNPLRDKKFPTLSHPRWEEVVSYGAFDYMEYWNNRGRKRFESLQKKYAREA